MIMDNLTKKQRSYNMSRIRSKGTKLEGIFFSLLKKNHISYKKHPKITGNPDCLIGKNSLVFVDSDFWHGWQFNRWKKECPDDIGGGKFR